MKFFFSSTPVGNTEIVEAIKSGSLKLIIEFDKESSIGLEEVGQIARVYQLMLLSENPRLSGGIYFRLHEKTENFDLTLIALLSLVKLSFDKIRISFDFGTVKKNSVLDKCSYKLGHFMTSGFLSHGKELFKIVKNQKTITLKPGKANLDAFLNISTEYLPLIYIDKDSHRKYFLSSFKDIWESYTSSFDATSFDAFLKEALPKGISTSKAEYYYQNIRRHGLQELRDKLNNHSKIDLVDLTHLYLFKTARKAGFLRKLFSDIQNIDEVTNGSFVKFMDDSHSSPNKSSKEKEEKYENAIEPLFRSLINKPPFFVLLFAILIDKFFEPKGERKASIENILYFTNDLFAGIRELSKNIVEHSNNKRGYVTARIFKKDTLMKLKGGQCVDNYLKNSQAKQFLDLVVIDDGEEGIASKTIKNLSALLSEFDNASAETSMINADLESLRSQKITLVDFFNTDDIKLEYQQIRTAASLGLIIFTDLLLKNRGYMGVTTPTLAQKVTGGTSECVEIYLSKAKTTRKVSEGRVPLGTSYTVLLPIEIEKVPLPRSERVPFETPFGESAFNNLFKIIVCKNGVAEQPSASGGKIFLLDVPLKAENKSDGSRKRIHVLIEQVSHELSHLKKLSDKKSGVPERILALNLKELEKDFDSSDIIRFLAGVQLLENIRSVIIYNLHTESFKGIVDTLKIMTKAHKTFWSNNNFILCYHNLLGGSHDASVIAGEHFDDFIWLNDQISKTNIGENYWSAEGSNASPSQEFKNDYSKNLLFSHHGYLLPFDILLENDGVTLFEHNALIELKKVL